MGYTTDFWGQFDLTPQLSTEQREYLRAFNETRRMARDEEKAALLPDPVREAVGLPVGHEGAYFVGGQGFMGQGGDDSVVEYNEAPGMTKWRYPDEEYDRYLARRQEAIENGAQPGLWCQWTPNDDGTAIVWDGGEKFYDYVEWIEYIIRNFLKPWGIVANGDVEWQGEEPADRGRIQVRDNVVRAATYTLHWAS